MNLLHPFGSPRRFDQFSKQQLLGIHALIASKNIPTDPSQDLFLQIADLESTLPDQTYTQTVRRYRSVMKVPAVLGALFAVALTACVLTLLIPDNDVLTKMAQALAAANAPSLPTLTATLAGVLFAAFISASLYVRSLAASLIGKKLGQWWNALLQRWAPDLAEQHDILNLAPATTAHLVAVHSRIQDVDLNLA